MDKMDITKQHEEFKNQKGLHVVYNDTTGYISVENDDFIIISVYDDGNWKVIKETIVECINEY